MAADLAVIVSEAGDISWISPALAQLRNDRDDELIGTPFVAALLHPDESNHFVDFSSIVDRIDDEFGFCSFSTQICDHEENPVPVQFTISRFLDDFQSAYMIVLRDIRRRQAACEGLVQSAVELDGARTAATDALNKLAREKERADDANESLVKINKQLSAAIARANTMAVDAEAANVAKSNFLANVSHELRTPINIIVGFSDLLVASGLTGELLEYVQGIKDASSDMVAIVSDILDYSRIEAGKIELELSDFDPRDVLFSVVNRYRGRAEEKYLDLSCNVDDSVPATLNGDSSRIKQIASCLVSNAVKFTEVGDVFLSLSVDGETSNGDIVLNLTVKDTGIGVNPEKLSELLKPFTQVDASTTRKFGGNGLGLAIAHRLTQLMGGDITVVSDPGVGSSFTAKLNVVAHALDTNLDENSPVYISDAQMPAGRFILYMQDSEKRSRIAAALRAADMIVLESGTPTDTILFLGDAAKSGRAIHYVVVDPIQNVQGVEILFDRLASESSFGDLQFVAVASPGEEDKAKSLIPKDLAAVWPSDLTGRTIDPLLRELLGLTDLASLSLSAGAPEELLGSTPGDEDSDTKEVKILVVDDVDVNRSLLTNILEGCGHKVSCAKDGREALEYAAETVFDVILMDCLMPVMDGFEAATRIRNLSGGSSQSPIVAVTASALPEARQMCIRSGMDDYIPKPIKRDKIVATIDRWLKLVKLHAASGANDDGDTAQQPTADEQESKDVQPTPKGEAPMSENQTTDTPHLDSHTLDSLRELDDGDFLSELFEGYIADAEKRLSDIQSQVSEQSLEGIDRLAHALKGASRNIGALRLGDLCEKLEHHDWSQSKITDELTALLENVNEEFGGVREEIKSSILTPTESSS